MRISKDLREFIELLNANGVEYVVVGGFAVAWHGYPRFTADIDFLVRPDRTTAELLVKRLYDFGFAALGVVPEDLCQPDELIRNKESAARPQDLSDAHALRKRHKSRGPDQWRP